MRKQNRPSPSVQPLDYSDNVECYEELANAIVLQAVADYKKELHAILQRDGNFDREDKNGEVHRLKRFFFSSWYAMLTKVDPDALVTRVKSLVIAEAEERRKKQLERLRRQAERERRETKSLLVALRSLGVDVKAVIPALQKIV